MSTRSIRHGHSAYARGLCRCGVCTEAHATYQRDWAARAAQVDRAMLRHGELATYINYACRCELCTAANSAYTRAYRPRRKASA